MKTTINEPLFFQVKPNAVKEDNEDGSFSAGAMFDWGMYNKAEIITDSEDGTTVFLDKTSSTQKNLVNINLMRLFACQIVKQLIKSEEIVHQEVYHKVNFKLPPQIETFVNDVMEELEKKVLAELFFQNNPIKPTKSKLESLSLFPKQEETTTNEQERTETTE